MGFDFYEWSQGAYLRLKTWRRGDKVGEDGEGNRYFRDRFARAGQRERRWVVFNGGESEATRVPPEWHAWLHHQIADAPSDANPLRRDWQAPHMENMTGTSQAYRPSGHPLAGGQRPPATGDYEPWTPS